MSEKCFGSRGIAATAISTLVAVMLHGCGAPVSNQAELLPQAIEASSFVLGAVPTSSGMMSVMLCHRKHSERGANPSFAENLTNPRICKPAFLNTNGGVAEFAPKEFPLKDVPKVSAFFVADSLYFSGFLLFLYGATSMIGSRHPASSSVFYTIVGACAAGYGFLRHRKISVCQRSHTQFNKTLINVLEETDVSQEPTRVLNVFTEMKFIAEHMGWNVNPDAASPFNFARSL